MLFSCKITNTILTYLEEQGEDLAVLYDSAPLPEEFLRDPSYWMRAEEMEAFFALSLRISTKTLEDNFLEKVAHQSSTLKSWGVLDSVLRMMSRPEEILQQPGRFLSYFVSPEPPVDNLIKNTNSVEFDLPISTEQYPLVTSFLQAAFESLPTFSGKPLANCKWEGLHLSISFNEQQETMFSSTKEESIGHQISPDLLRSVITQLEKSQKELEDKNKELSAKNEQLVQVQRDLDSIVKRDDEKIIAEPKLKHMDFEFEFGESGVLLQQNLSRLQDYMVRAQQLITMLIAQDRMTPSVREAMKRVDWERVKEQFPTTIRESRQIIEELKNTPQKNMNNIEQPKEISHVRDH